MPDVVVLPPQRLSVEQDVLAVVHGDRAPRLAFQPIVDLQRGKVVGYEALARLGARMSTGPARWFQAAAAGGRSAELEGVLLRHALERRPELPAGAFLSVNVSPDLLGSAAVGRAFAEAGDLTGVVVELTEHVAVANLVALSRRLDLLRAAGAALALDDVGAGWSGLKQLAALRPDIVKVDSTLVAGVDGDSVKHAVVELLVGLASRLDAQLLVEGVERYEELDVLARLGVPLGQGYVLGRPNARFADLDDDLGTRLAFRGRATRQGDVIAAHVDVTTRPLTPDTLAAELARPPAEVVRATALVDTDRHPTHVCVRHDNGDRVEIVLHPVMTVRPEEHVATVLRRAMTRPPAHRFDPMVCIDRAGRYVGTVDVDALVLASARV